MNKLKVFAVLCLISTMAYAGGYRVSLQSTRQLAMGHTGVAIVNSADVLFFNPAGLVHLENKLNVSVGGTGVFSDVQYQDNNTGAFAETDSPVGTPFYAYASYAVSDRFAVGLGIYTPYGSNVTWPTDWEGSHLVNEIELQAIFIQPTISYQLFENVSLGVGAMIAIGSVDFNRNAGRSLVNEEGERSNVAISDSGVVGLGWNAGILFTPTDNLSIGFNYRSLIDIESEDGEATFSNFANSPLLPSNGVQGFEATLPLPAEATLGIAYSCNKWLFAFDYNRQFWSEYENLDIQFEDGSQSLNPRNYKDSSVYRFGIQYTATDVLTLRAGYYFDESPVQSGFFAPETPRNDSNGYTFGLSYNLSQRFAIDASFLLLRFAEVTESYDFFVDPGTTQPAPFSGTYKSSVIAPSIGITYNL